MILFLHSMQHEEEDRQELLKKIGARLRYFRKKRGYKNSDAFAFDHELNRSQYGKYEAGRIDMQITTLLKILKAMDVSPNEFFKEEL